MPSNDTDRYDTLTEWLSSVYQDRLYQACSAADLTPTQFIALSAIEQLQEPKMSVLAHRLGLSPSGATTLLDRLVKQDVVERFSPPGDRRAVCVHLTPKGAQALTLARAKRRELMRQPLLHLDDTTRQHLFTSLEALRRAWEAVDNQAPVRTPS